MSKYMKIGGAKVIDKNSYNPLELKKLLHQLNFQLICHETFTADNCRDDEFYCGGQCIERERVCDGRPDCVDYSDELNCTGEPNEPPTEVTLLTEPLT
jgi:hypothetical protein